MAEQPFPATESSMSTLETELEALSLFFSKIWRRWTACYRPQGNDDMVIQVQNEGMMFSPHFPAESQPVSGPMWQKHILMGGKCELPDFSGVIIYDPAGNVVTPSKPSQLALPWR